MVFGSVALWGTVLKHTKGYRCQYAYPQKLFHFKCAFCNEFFDKDFNKSVAIIVLDENNLPKVNAYFACSKEKNVVGYAKKILYDKFQFEEFTAQEILDTLNQSYNLD